MVKRDGRTSDVMASGDCRADLGCAGRPSPLGAWRLTLPPPAPRPPPRWATRPSSSPYRDIRKGHTFTPIYGHFGGDGGEFGIGPHDGPAYGFRYDIRTGSTIQFGLGLAYAELKRLIVDPFVELANRVSGPVDQTVTFAEVNLQFNLTGGKTWHRLAPFVGCGRRPHVSQQHARGHQPVQVRPQDLPGADRRRAHVRDRPALPPRRGPGGLLEAQVSHDIRGRARARAGLAADTPTP